MKIKPVSLPFSKIFTVITAFHALSCIFQADLSKPPPTLHRITRQQTQRIQRHRWLASPCLVLLGSFLPQKLQLQLFSIGVLKKSQSPSKQPNVKVTKHRLVLVLSQECIQRMLRMVPIRFNKGFMLPPQLIEGWKHNGLLVWQCSLNVMNHSSQ